MPTTIFDVHGQTEGAAIHLVVETSTGRYERTVTKAKIDTSQKLAGWLLAQPTPAIDDDEGIRQRLAVTWHEERVTGPLTGDPVTIKVIDSAEAQTAAEDTAWSSLLASPLATVTIAQADAAVDGITNLAEAKVYLKKVNALVIHLRDIEKRLLEALRDAGIR